MTLLELMMTVAVVGLLTAVAVPTYRSAVLKAQISTAKVDLVIISHAIKRYWIMRFENPETLDDLSGIPRVDPWGHDYRFLNFASSQPGVQGKIRKDHNLHPLNTEFDLYSVGPDGKSVPPLTGKPSRDDILWARDGAFVDVATEF